VIMKFFSNLFWSQLMGPRSYVAQKELAPV
jgi:hypothetical protein